MITGIDVGMPEFVDVRGAVVVGATRITVGTVCEVNVFVPVGCIEAGAGEVIVMEEGVTVVTRG